MEGISQFNFSVISKMIRLMKYIQGGAHLGFQSWVCETQSPFSHDYLLVIALLFHTNNCKPTFATPVCFDGPRRI